MAVRALTLEDAGSLERFVVLASFAPGRVPEDAAGSPRVRRWLAGWPGPGDLGVGQEENGQLAGVALARVVEPTRVWDAAGLPVPEILVAVEVARQSRGIGAGLVAGRHPGGSG